MVGHAGWSVLISYSCIVDHGRSALATVEALAGQDSGWSPSRKAFHGGGWTGMTGAASGFVSEILDAGEAAT